MDRLKPMSVIGTQVTEKWTERNFSKLIFHFPPQFWAIFDDFSKFHYEKNV